MKKKFRVWDSYNKKMMLCNFIIRNKGADIYHFCEDTYHCGAQEYGIVLDRIIDDSDVMQYIGIKDVCEKDIIKYENIKYGYGDPNQPEYLYMLVPDITELYADDIAVFHCQYGEVVGNYYENPDIYLKHILKKGI
jgi:hypothetical protein